MLNLVPLAGEQVSDLEIKPLNLKSKKNHWAEALQRFRSRSQGVATAASVFVKLNQNNYKYWYGNAVYFDSMKQESP